MTSYRTNDGTRWGAGLGRNLTPTEVDLNFWDAVQRIAALEALPDAPPSITSFSVDGAAFYVHFSNGAILGPYELPVKLFRFLESGWQPSTEMLYLDAFVENGILYVVLRDHTSGLTFDPGANGGIGLDYYFPMLAPPGNSLPTGGAAGQVLTKSTSSDYAVTWTWKFPAGTTGKYLRQASNTQDDTEWSDVLASEVEFTPVTGSPLTSDNVADALEELASGVPIDAGGIPFTPNTGSGLLADNVQDAINEVASSGSSGRQTIWMPAAGMTPLLTNGADAGLFETPSDKMIVKTLDYDATTGEGAQFEIAMPKSWDKEDLKFKLFWSHPTSVANFGVAWQVFVATYPATGGAAGNLDSFPDGQITVTSTGGTEDSLYSTDESDPLTVLDNYTGDPPLDGQLMIIHVWRNPDDAADTMAVDARLHGIQIFYNTSAGTDD